MIILFDNTGKILDLLQGNGNNNFKIDCITIQHEADLKKSVLDFLEPDSEIPNSDEYFENWKQSYIGQDISIFEDENNKVKTALQNLRYKQINQKTQELIYAGIDYTYNGKTVHFYFDQFNQLEFTALRIKADADELSFPYKVWEGNNNLEFENKTDLISFLNSVFDYIQSKKIEGKNLRDSLLTKTISELVSFEDPR